MIVSTTFLTIMVGIALFITVLAPIALLVFWIKDWKDKKLW
jgi:hypothetical protein